MQALSDAEREAVKQAHPELDAVEVDRLLDQLDALRVEQSLLDPETEQEAVRRLDARCAELKKKLPKLAETHWRAR
ncbi:MAG: hypothetical protein JOZ96_09595 [Acidobacteria bacterium]|nr:hypothetical protein [Acidobacteriota bacterium]